MTGLDYVKSALRLCGVQDATESPTGAEGDDALNVLNRMMRGWSMEMGGPIFSRKILTHTLTAGTARYTIGNTDYTSDPPSYDDILTYRPQQVLNATIRSSGIDYPLELVSFAEYQDISNKTPGNNRPTQLCYNASAPSGVIYLNPPPDSAYSLRLTVLAPFINFALSVESGDAVNTQENSVIEAYSTSKTTIDGTSLDYFFPPGYDDAIVSGLAFLLGAEYGIPMSRLSVIKGMAEKAKARLYVHNMEVENLQSDPLLPVSHRTQGWYDWNA